MGEKAIFALPTTVTRLEQVARCGRIVAEAAFRTKLAVAGPNIIAWFSAHSLSVREFAMKHFISYCFVVAMML